MNKRRIILIVALLLVGAAAFVLFATRTSSPDTTMRVTGSFYPLYEFARQVGGTKATAVNMTPAGVEPHDHEPTPQQLVTARQSGVFIYNGAGFEPWVQKFLPDYKGTAVAGSTDIELRRSGEETDPHYWLDPVFAQKTVLAIRDGLAKADPLNTSYYRERAAEYNAKLALLNADITKGLATCQQRTVITSHDAFGYFGARYNLQIVPIAGLSPNEEPSPAKLAELSNLITTQGIKYVFFESLVSPKLAETLASETGASTATFDTIEGISNEDQEKGKDYISVQRENLKNLRTALACQ